MLEKKHGKAQLFLYLSLNPHYEITAGLDFQANRNICCHCWEMKLSSSVIDYNPYMGWNKNGLRPPHNLQIPGFITVIFNLAKTSVVLRLLYVRCPATGSHTLLADLGQLGCNAVFSASFFNTHILVSFPLYKRPKTKLNSVALVRTRTILTERPPPVGEVSANFCG